MPNAFASPNEGLLNLWEMEEAVDDFIESSYKKINIQLTQLQ
jgi:hypothetical protein